MGEEEEKQPREHQDPLHSCTEFSIREISHILTGVAGQDRLCGCLSIFPPRISHRRIQRFGNPHLPSLYGRIYLFFIHARSQDRGTFLALVTCGIPCFPVTLLGSFVYNRIVMKAGRTGEPDNVPGSCSSYLLF